MSGSDDNTAILWNFKGERLCILKGSHGKITKVNFSADGREMLTGSENGEILIWKIPVLPNRQKIEQVANFTPFDYSMYDLSEFNFNNIYHVKNLKDLYLTTLSYINSIPETNLYPEDNNYINSLKLALKQCDSLFTLLVGNKHFKDSINISAQKLLYDNYAQVCFNKPDLLLLTYQKNNNYIHSRFADRDIIDGHSALLGNVDLNDGLFYMDDLNNVIANLMGVKSYPLALNYAIAAKSLTEELLTKKRSDTDTRVLKESNITYNNLAKAYLYNYKYNKTNASKAQLYSQKAISIIKNKYPDYANLIAADLLMNKYDDAIKVYKRSKTALNSEGYDQLKTESIYILNDLMGMTNNTNLRRFKKYIQSGN